MRTVVIEPHFESWRETARELLGQGVPPHETLWQDNAQEGGLFEGSTEAHPAASMRVPKVPAAFLDLAQTVAAHSDERRWGLLYRVLWRLTHGGERQLLAVATDPDVRVMQTWRKAVSRDIHKMHAFVRFRLVAKDEMTGRERFVAWFEPEHRIVRLAAPFFEARFAGMDWSILTPDECVHWNGSGMHFTQGVSKSGAQDTDVLDDLWRTYYKSIFNPARLKVTAMQSEMPKKYWKNLPEASLIADLIAGSSARVQHMMDTEERPVKAAPNNVYLESLRRMNASPAPVKDTELEDEARRP